MTDPSIHWSLVSSLSFLCSTTSGSRNPDKAPSLGSHKLVQEKKDAVHPPPRPASPPLLCLPGPKGYPETGHLIPSIHKLSSLPGQE